MTEILPASVVRGIFDIYHGTNPRQLRKTFVFLNYSKSEFLIDKIISLSMSEMQKRFGTYLFNENRQVYKWRANNDTSNILVIKS